MMFAKINSRQHQSGATRRSPYGSSVLAPDSTAQMLEVVTLDVTPGGCANGYPVAVDGMDAMAQPTLRLYTCMLAQTMA